jgi:hypothetical protein
MLLVKEAQEWMARGVYDPEAIFNLMYTPGRPVHYSKIREAVHHAKVI